MDFESDRRRIEEFGREVAGLIASYFRPRGKVRIFPPVTPARLEQIIGQAIPAVGARPETILRDFREKVLKYSTNIRQPNYFGLMDAPPATVAVFADALASALNQNMATWFSSPVATQVEKTVVRWLCRLTGYDEGSGGLFVSGASLGNLLALKTARDRGSRASARQRGLGARGRLVFYASRACHSSLVKAAGVLGIGTRNLRMIRLDECFRMKSSSLEARIRRDRSRGLVPFCVVATAGTVSSGAIDPLREIALVCRENDLWFHVDAAYGGALLFSDKHRMALDGIAEADSMTLSAHKWLFVPVDCALLLVRRERDLVRDFRQRSDFSPGRTADDATLGIRDYQDYGLETSRRFNALKLWMTIRYFGAAGLGAAIDRNIELTRQLDETVRQDPDFEAMHRPQTGILCFRYFPANLRQRWTKAHRAARQTIEQQVDRMNIMIQSKACREGQVWFGLSTLRGHKVLQVYVGSFLTETRHLKNLFRTIKRIGRRLHGGGRAARVG